MQTFFDFCNEMLCVADSRGYFTRVNPAWTKTLGWSAEELTSRPFIDFVHPDDKQATIREAELLLSGTHETILFENRYVCQDGSYRWLAWQTRFAPDTKELIATARDVTALKLQTEALREAEERFRVLATQAPVGIFQADRTANCTFVNQHWSELTGLSGEESLGHGWMRAIHPEDLPRVMAKWEACTRGQLEYSDEFRLVRKNGDVRFVVTAARETKDAQGNIAHYIGTMLDITERREKEELLLNLIDVQEKERQLLCHEFHDGLIQYVVGSLMTLEGYQHELTEASATIDSVIGNLRKGVEDGRRVIRGVRPAVLDDSGLDAAIDDLIDQYSSSGIMVTSKCDPEIGRLPDSIQTTVYRVVQEALNNARKHSGTDVVRIELKKVNGDLHLEVQDFGCGFDVESARKRGFGLRGMAERVRLLGGECLIKSERDVGTRISVRLPIPLSDNEA